MGISHLALFCHEGADMSWLPVLFPDLPILLKGPFIAIPRWP